LQLSHFQGIPGRVVAWQEERILMRGDLSAQVSRIEYPKNWQMNEPICLGSASLRRSLFQRTRRWDEHSGHVQKLAVDRSRMTGFWGRSEASMCAEAEEAFIDAGTSARRS
jgi:hypothetical protein